MNVKNTNWLEKSELGNSIKIGWRFGLNLLFRFVGFFIFAVLICFMIGILGGIFISSMMPL